MNASNTQIHQKCQSSKSITDKKGTSVRANETKNGNGILRKRHGKKTHRAQNVNYQKMFRMTVMVAFKVSRRESTV